MVYGLESDDVERYEKGIKKQLSGENMVWLLERINNL